jgi:hypothetical protein
MKNAKIPAIFIFFFGMISTAMAQNNPVVNDQRVTLNDQRVTLNEKIAV